MKVLADIVIIIVVMLHLYFLVLEMFLWDKPVGLKVFGQTKEQANATKLLAANQGLYNGFVAAGLLLGVIQGLAGYDFKAFFLICVVIAGVYGSITANRKILYFQAIPGLLGLILLLVSY